MNKDQYLKIARSLEGETPVAVEYLEINYEYFGDEQSDFSKKTDYDSLDFGLNLKMQSGKVFGLSWGREFTQYALSLMKRSIQAEVPEVAGSKEVDVTQSPNWSQIVGSQIKTVEGVWQWVDEETRYPQSIVVNFASSAVIVVSALEITDSSFWGTADNIVVFFSLCSAISYKTLISC